MTTLLRFLIPAALFAAPAPAAPPQQPNVVVILTDDQGYGDLGSNNNPAIKTPRLDALAKESARFRWFYVSPVCSPTRASLFTGRYNYRTGVVDTFRGRSIMRPDEVTIPEILGPAGFRTGLFGKWHLGDNAPCRPIDQGFAESYVVKGGGVGQGSDPPGGGPGNFNPTIQHNGKSTPTRGYTTDLFTDAAIRFVEAEPARPFFMTLAYNVPHVPLDVPGPDGTNLKPDDVTGRINAMVAELDRNVGRLLDRLDQLGVGDRTMVWFLSDNGPDQPRFNGGLRDRKGTVYEGGIRVPCFVRWRGVIPPGRVVEPTAAHIDIAPTILAACGASRPDTVRFDGRDLLPLLRGVDVAWEPRTLYFQWHRGDAPERFRNIAARGPRYKLVQPFGASGAANVDPPPLPVPPRFELYDIVNDPGESRDLAASHPREKAALVAEYERWFADVTSGPPGPVRIWLGSDREDPAVLTRQDWRGEGVVRDPAKVGGWDVEVVSGGTFDLELTRSAGPAGTLHVQVGGADRSAPIAAGDAPVELRGLTIPAGPTRLRAWVESGGTATGIASATVRRRP